MLKSDSFKKRFFQNGLNGFDKIERLDFLLSLRLDTQSNYSLAKELSTRYKSLNNVVDEPEIELRKISGLEENHLLGLKLPFHFSNQYLFEKILSNPVTSSPNAVYNYLIHSMRGKKNEQFNVLYLNTRNQILKNEVLFNGTISQVVVYPREVIKSALSHNASGLILAHNHPSGNLEPSEEDINLTKKMRDITNLLDINLLDHIIIAGNKYLSFSERGYL